MPKNTFSEREIKALAFIVSFYRKEGYEPSYRQIQASLDLSHPFLAARTCLRLCKKGLLIPINGKSGRGYRLAFDSQFQQIAGELIQAHNTGNEALWAYAETQYNALIQRRLENENT